MTVRMKKRNNIDSSGRRPYDPDETSFDILQVFVVVVSCLSLYFS